MVIAGGRMVSRVVIEWANNFLLRLARRRAALLTGGFDPGAPSQRDKPSPKSSYSVSFLRSRLLKLFPPSEGFLVSRIANTNSMEPLFDDSDLVVLELLTGRWRRDRLRREPFAPGQVVVYPSSVGRIIHVLKERTIFLGRPAWVVQGFNNFLPDMAKILEDRIESRLVLVGYGRRVREGD